MTRRAPQTPGPSSAPTGAVDFQDVISATLRYGVRLSFACILVGSLLGLVLPGRYGSGPEDLKLLIQPGTAAGFPSGISQLVHGVALLQPHSIVVLGLLILILTPVLRVAISILLFAVQKDRLFSILTSLVFLLLIISFLLGRG